MKKEEEGVNPSRRQGTSSLTPSKQHSEDANFTLDPDDPANDQEEM
jgi:hypothetical protein